YVAASNDRLARSLVFFYPGLFPERISIALEDGSVVVIDRSLPADTPIPVQDGSEGRWLLEGQIAYLRIPSFGDAAYERTAIQQGRKFSAAPNLVIDVRGNGGGTTPRQLIAALMNRAWRTWHEMTPQRLALFEANGVPPISAARASRPQPASSDA